MIKVIDNPVIKSEICLKILRNLPEWFGIEEALLDYVEQVKSLEFICYEADQEPVGFVALENTSIVNYDMHVLGVLKSHQGLGIGSKLLQYAEGYARKKSKKYMTVKTLSADHSDPNYKKTRHFYQQKGYEHLEVFKTLWDEYNPCLLMIKSLHHSILEISDTLRLRPVHKSDYKTAVEWYSNENILWYSENRKEPYNMNEITKMYDYLSKNDVLYFIEIFDSYWKPIGDVTLSRDRMPMVICPSYQGKGIGSQVLKFLLNHAKTIGYECIKLSGIYLYNDKSLATYKKQGFIETHRDEQKIYLEKVL